MSNETTRAVTWQTEEEAKEVALMKRELDIALSKDLTHDQFLMLAQNALLTGILDLLQKRLPPRSEGCFKPEEN